MFLLVNFKPLGFNSQLPCSTTTRDTFLTRTMDLYGNDLKVFMCMSGVGYITVRETQYFFLNAFRYFSHVLHDIC